MTAPQPPTPPQQPITRVDLFRRMPQGGTEHKPQPRVTDATKAIRHAIRSAPTGGTAYLKPAMNTELRDQVAEALQALDAREHESDSIVDTVMEVFQVWLERHNTELRQPQQASFTLLELLDLHAPVVDEGDVCCQHCGDVYPCETVATIRKTHPNLRGRVYDDHAYHDDGCRLHEPVCWCDPANPKSITYDPDSDLCRCPSGEDAPTHDPVG